MADFLLWLYLSNSVLLINHEIDSASIHSYFLKNGRKEFDKPISKLMLAATLIVSTVQLIVTTYLIFA